MQTHPRFRNVLLAAISALTMLAVAQTAAAQFQPWEGSEILNDPEWRARFLGSYGFLSGEEPPIKQQELQLLRDVIDLMKVNLPAATARLQTESGESSSPALDFVLANLLFQGGALEEAKTVYRRAIEKFPDFRRAHKNLGLLLVQEQDFAGGAKHLTRAVELGERGGRNYGLLGYCHINLDNPFAAEVAYRNAMLQEPDSRDWKLGLARSLLAMNENSEAVALFDDMLARDPADATAWMLQANAYLALDRPDAAAVNLETVRLLGKADASSLKLLGDIYMNEGQPWMARDAYLALIASDGSASDFQTAHRAADLLIRTQAYDEARDVIDATRAKYGNGLTQTQELELLTLTARLERQRGNALRAAGLLESIVERDGTRGEALLELARYYQGVGQTEKAEFMVERAEKLEKWEYRALLDHAQIMVARKDYARAAELLRRALAIENEPRVERFLASIESAMGT